MFPEYALDIPESEKKSRDKNTARPLLGYLAAAHVFGSNETREEGHSLAVLAPEHMTPR
jgi:hypothetical protein